MVVSAKDLHTDAAATLDKKLDALAKSRTTRERGWFIFELPDEIRGDKKVIKHIMEQWSKHGWLVEEGFFTSEDGKRFNSYAAPGMVPSLKFTA
jgi:hypothetical protein